MRGRLLFTYLTLTTFVLLILEIPLGVTFATHERRALSSEVERDAFVMASSAEDVLEGIGTTDLKALATLYQKRTGARVVIVNTNGIAVADSAPTTPAEVNFSTRPEIVRALAGDVATGVRHSATLKTDLLFVAVPVASGGVVHGAVRITYPTLAVDARVSRNWLSLALVALVALAAAFLIGWRFASSVARPLRALEETTVRLAAGDLNARAPTTGGPPEVRSVARAFNDMAARLEELVGAQRQFVADASHQLRTPMTALQLRIENIEDSANGALRDEAEAAGREVWRLQRIVDGLLALARAEGRRPHRRIEDVPSVIEARRMAWQPLADERSIALEIATQEADALIVPGGLEQILDNLIANAIEVTPKSASIRLTCARKGNAVEIHVLDSGPDMTDEQRMHAFDRFWRGTADKDTGSGLGLAIVRQLARASGGDVRLERAPGGGIDAVVRLPVADPPLARGAVSPSLRSDRTS